MKLKIIELPLRTFWHCNRCEHCFATSYAPPQRDDVRPCSNPNCCGAMICVDHAPLAQRLFELMSDPEYPRWR